MESGGTYKDHLQSLKRQGVDVSEELGEVPIPFGCSALLECFKLLKHTSGIEKKITNQEILAWCQLYKVELLPVEIDIIHSADFEAMKAFHEHNG